MELLPSEIFSYILSYNIDYTDVTSVVNSITHVLLVCKKWNSKIKEATYLWNLIYSKLNLPISNTPYHDLSNYFTIKPVEKYNQSWRKYLYYATDKSIEFYGTTINYSTFNYCKTEHYFFVNLSDCLHLYTDTLEEYRKILHNGLSDVKMIETKYGLIFMTTNTMYRIINETLFEFNVSYADVVWDGILTEKWKYADVYTFDFNLVYTIIRDGNLRYHHRDYLFFSNDSNPFEYNVKLHVYKKNQLLWSLDITDGECFIDLFWNKNTVRDIATGKILFKTYKDIGTISQKENGIGYNIYLKNSYYDNVLV